MRRPSSFDYRGVTWQGVRTNGTCSARSAIESGVLYCWTITVV